MRAFGSPMRSLALALALVATHFGHHALLADASPSPTIQASIHTSWAAPPLLLEILEAVAVENTTAYYPLLRQLTDIKFLATIKSLKDLYEKSLALIESGEHVSAQSLPALKWSLAMHTTAPWIQAHYHLYNSTIVPDRVSKSGFDLNCGVWVDWYDRQICTVSELKAVVAGGLDQFSKKSKSKPTTMELDHVLAAQRASDLFTILYADVYDPEFTEFRRYLDTLAEEHGLQYSVRYKPSNKNGKNVPLTLAGYGVELALKSTDYIVIDDRDLGHSDDDSRSGQTVFRPTNGKDLFGDEVPAVEPVSKQDLGDLALAAATFVLKSEDPLKTLVAVTQDFPKYQRKISKISYDPTLRFAVQQNAMHLRDPKGKVWLNNQPVPAHKMNPFNLLRLIRRERDTLNSFATMGISAAKAVDLLTDASITASSGEDDNPVGVFDVRDKSEGKNLVVWINDLESDHRYQTWGRGLERVLQPTYGGQFHQVRRNLISALFAMDLSSPGAIEVLAFELTNYVQRLVPFRFGVLPLVKSDDGDDAKMAMLWRHIVSRHGIKGGLEFLKKALLAHLQGGKDMPTATRNSFIISAQSAKLKNTITPEMTYEEVLASNSPYRTWLTSLREMTSRIGIDAPSLFINGKYFAWEQDHGRNLMMEAPLQTQFIAQKLLSGEMQSDNGEDLYDYFLTRPGVFERRNPYIFTSDDKPLKMVDLVQGQPQPFVDRLSYISTSNEVQPLATVHVISNFDSKQGLAIATEAISALGSDQKGTRVALIQNGPVKGGIPGLGQFVQQSTVDGKTLPIAFWKELLEDITNGSTFIDSFKKAAAHHPEVALIGMEGSKGLEAEVEQSARLFLRDAVKAKESETIVLVNGRIVGPIEEAFSASDFKLLIDYEKNIRINKIHKLMESASIKATESNTMKITSIVYGAAQQLDQGLYDINESVISRDRTFGSLNTLDSGFVVKPTVTAGGELPMFRFTAVLDPVSELTQRWAPILEAISQMDGVQVEIALLPALHLTEAPIKRFYRYVVEPELQFDAAGNIVPPSAYFTGLPEPTLLTLGVDVNPAWVVTSKVCIHDLDNLKLSSLTGSSRTIGVKAEFELHNILVEGFARDITQKTPPKGAQFILGTKAEPHIADTLVMANMGYFQLKANPGVWEMILRPGRTNQVFDIESIGSEGWVPGGVKNDKRDVVVANFEGLVLYPRLIRNPGMEMANVQDEIPAEGSIWNSIKSTIKGLTNTTKPAKKKADINIFSVASGHLYERFLSIMILSVIKNTDSRVKFWFIENFLSPSFKDFIPHMAEKYDFDYELVTYNWPHWLRAQTEKQRIIWAYKILFLDVLFPLDLDKVIFVDADQIVRADMKELVDLDLHGAPYGYTPMCQDRKEMEGFRFWNQGYWKDHLKEKPYHISALYVIDLVKFRQMQAGDRLRNHYQQLSRDPHSLANLDQDLPNNMQNDVPIFSLPQEWLWCETWCGDEGLSRAKTIDLCNNPLTKEPKLDRARRQIKEWESLDNEATEYVKQVAAGFKAARRQQQESETEADHSNSEDVHARKDEL